MICWRHHYVSRCFAFVQVRVCMYCGKVQARNWMGGYWRTAKPGETAHMLGGVLYREELYERNG